MKYAFLFLLILPATFLNAQVRTRTSTNKEDMKYFDDQLEKIFKTTLSFLKAKYNRNAGDRMISKDTFLLYIPFKAQSEQEMLHTIDNGGSMIAFIFWNDLLKEFPDIKIFSLSVPCNSGKKIKVNFYYNKNGSISFFSQLQKRWLTQRCSAPK